MLNRETVDDLKGSKGKEVLVRRDFNVPLKKGVIQNYNHIDGAILTIKKLLNQGTKVILCPHLDKPKGEPVPEMSLASVAPVLSKRLDVEAKSMNDAKVTGPGTQKIAARLKDGEVLLLQNTHYGIEKTKFKDGDAATGAYVRELADLCDGIFVNDTSGTAHGTHCSNVDVTRYTRENVVGYLMEKEVKFLGRAVENPVRPFVVILEGAKVSDKINMINGLPDKVDILIISGGMVYTFAKAQGQEIGSSSCEEDKLDYALKMVKRAEKKGVKLPLPVDHVEGKELSNEAEHKVVDVIDAGWSGLDIGPKTIAPYKDALRSVKTIVWDGPVGVSEFSNFAEGTLEVCRVVADLVDTTTAVGGSDSVDAVKRLGFADKMTHISTGGGASLEFLEGKKLPDITTADNKD